MKTTITMLLLTQLRLNATMMNHGQSVTYNLLILHQETTHYNYF